MKTAKKCKDFTQNRIFLHKHCLHARTFLHLCADVTGAQCVTGLHLLHVLHVLQLQQVMQMFQVLQVLRVLQVLQV